MAVVLIVREIEKLSRRGRKIVYEPTFSGSYANPEVLDFASATNPSFLPAAYPGMAPSEIIIENPIAGYAFSAAPGTTISNSTLKIFGPSGSIALGGGMTTFSPGGGDIKGAPAANVAIAGGSLPTNGALLSSLAAANNTTAFTIAVQPDVPRNIGIVFKNTVAGASTGNAVDVVIVGTFRGAAQTETISFTALELTSTAQNELAAKYGALPFDTITSITPSAAQPASWQHAAGPGCKIGLPQLLATAAEADVKKVTKTAANFDFTGKVSGANNTVDVGVLADGDDVGIIYAATNEGVGSLTLAPALLPASTMPAAIVTDTAKMRIAAIFRF